MKAIPNLLLGLFVLGVGIALGLAVADLDQHVPFVQHRSLVTHSFLLTILLFWLARKWEAVGLRLLAVGVGLATAVHLSFDLFPRAWLGFALISVPFYGRLSPTYSIIWIAFSLLICLHLAAQLAKNLLHNTLLILTIIVIFGIQSITERLIFLPLLVLAAATAVNLPIPWPQLLFKKGRHLHDHST